MRQEVAYRPWRPGSRFPPVWRRTPGTAPPGPVAPRRPATRCRPSPGAAPPRSR